MLTLPALRLTAEGKGRVIEEGVSLDPSPNNGLSVISNLPEPRQNDIRSMKENVEGGLSSTANSVKSEDIKELQDIATGDGSPQPTNVAANSNPERTNPQLSRTLSMPLPSQLRQLQNPHRPGPLNPHHSSPQISSVRPSRVDEVSVELADSIQLVIQTMLQISPPQVLDPAKEQFSACALSVPTSSMSAMFTAMKNINYISANMSSFCDGSLPNESSSADECRMGQHNEFDVGELLQCLGDALSGAAAQAGVDLVIYHGEVGVKRVHVLADESGISFAISHIVRQILNTTERGDSIELGLLVGPIPISSNFTLPLKASDGEIRAPPVDQNPALHVTIRISHRFAENNQNADLPPTPLDQLRPKPYFSTLLFRRILHRIGGTLRSDLPPPDFFSYGRTCEFDLVLDKVETPPVTPLCTRSENQSIQPTLDQLSIFGETLKGKRVTLYGNVKGSFAHHLTSCLTAWGMDVTHVSPGGDADGSTDKPAQVITQNPNPNPVSIDPAPTRVELRTGSPELVFIDDDVDMLKDRLHALRSGNPSNTPPRKKPSLQANHRPRSSQQVTRVLNNLRAPTSVVVLHFTSLSNYKLVKDVVQSTLASYAAMAIPLPEVMIIPKPAGPRRFLIALHTSITRPMVDPFFIPIATSPTSPGSVPMQIGSTPNVASPVGEITSNQASLPGSQGTSAAITPSQTQSPSAKTSTRPTGSRTNSERSIKSLEGSGGLVTSALPPSPLALPDNVEYFSATAQKLGNSPSSGVIIQSPDGQTAGIYFHPRGKNGSRNQLSNNTEKAKIQVGPTPSRRPSASRVVTSPNKEDTMSFSSLYATPQKTTSTKSASPPPDIAVPNIQEPSPSPPSGTPLLAPSPIKIITTPLDVQQLKPSTPSPSRRVSEDARGIQVSPAVGPREGSSSPTKRSSSKKPFSADTKDAKNTASPSKQKGKISATGDANVVPPISVLIVDDNPINQTILSTFMKRKNIKYDLASNGQEAVQKWWSGGFHLILMDIQMPIMDGIQATKEIRRLEKITSQAGYPPTSEGQTPSEVSAATPSPTSSFETRNLNSPYRSSVIIVALTASSLQSDRVAALAAGCNDFLTKPVSLLWLNNKIIEWGSIKALQMWADIRPEAVRSMASGQAQQAKNIADRLHVPSKGRATPIQAVRSPSTIDENAAALALASSAGPIPGLQAGSSGLNTLPSPIVPTSALGSPALDPPEVKPSLMLSNSVEGDDKLKVKAPQGNPSRRSNSRPRMQAGFHTPVSSDSTPLSGVAESVKIQNGSTTVVNLPSP